MPYTTVTLERMYHFMTQLFVTHPMGFGLEPARQDRDWNVQGRSLMNIGVITLPKPNHMLCVTSCLIY